MPVSGSSAKSWALSLLLVLMTFCAYWPVVHAGFIWDDDHYVSENPLMTRPDGLRRLWTPNQTDQYYPLVYTSFWVEWRLWGPRPMGFHVANVALHALNAVLIWILLLRLGMPGGWLAAAIFALHPVHVESVAWITERKNVLSGLFYLLALYGYLRFEENKERRWYLGALGCFFLGLLSKTVICTLPVVILLLRWRRKAVIGRRDLVNLLPFFLLALAMGILTIWVERHHAGARGPEFDLSFAQRVLLAGRALWFYAGKLAWPANLAFNYERWKLDAADLFQWLWVFGALGAAGLAWAFRKRLGRGPASGLGFFALTLSPALGFLNVFPQRYSFVADHFQYLASLGLIAAAVGGAVSFLKERQARKEAALLAAVILGSLGFFTRRQTRVYRDLETLWRDTLMKNPKSALAHQNLGFLLSERRDHGAAIGHFREALKAKPDFMEAHYDLGGSLAAQGKLDEAILHYRQALQLRPDYFDARNNLGLALAGQGKLGEAVSQYRQVLKAKPDHVQARLNLGNALARQGGLDEAIAHYREALRLAPALAEAYNNLGFVLAAQGRYEEAARCCREALRLRPDYAQARDNLRLILSRWPGAGR